MHILFVSAYTPSRIRVRSYNFIKALVQRGHQVTLVCGATGNDTAALDELRRICERVVAVRVTRAGMLWNALRALPGDLPLQAALNVGRPMVQAVQGEVVSGRYDVVHVEHLRAMALHPVLQPLPSVLDAVDSISLLFERTLRGSPTMGSRAMALMDLARTRRYEARYFSLYDQVLVSSPEDARALQELARMAGEPAVNRQVHVIPNGVDLSYFSPIRRERLPATLVLSGKMSYHANVAAALFLVDEIMPLVWSQRAGVQVVVAGSAPPRAVRRLARDARVTVTGYLDDLRPHLARATLAVCPLRYGVGIQNKVLEAMAMETPVVAAHQAARALQARPGVECLLAGHAREYARSILALLDDASLRARLGQAGRHYVETQHRWDSAAARLEQVYVAVAEHSNRHRRPGPLQFR